MGGFLSGKLGSRFWGFIRSKTPKKYQDDLERALRKGHEVVSAENQKDNTIQQAKEAVKASTEQQAEKNRRMSMDRKPFR